MRVNFMEISTAESLGIRKETSIYLNSRYLPNLGYYPFEADTEMNLVKCFDFDMSRHILYGDVEIYIPNDAEKYPGIKELGNG